MTEQQSFDLVVIGGGPGGYVAAIRAAQLGIKTAVVEANHMGGICLNWGCIPTKALLRSSEIYHLLHNLDAFGLTVIDGYGKLAGKGKVSVEKDGKKISEISYKNVLLATGARARSLPNLEPDGKLVWTYREAMLPDVMPKSLLVVGSGAIGIEFASFYRTLGAEVTVVEVMDRILPVEDEEISKLAQKAFEKQGMKIHTTTTVKSLKKGKNNVTATLEAGGKSSEITVDRVILAVGIVGNVENLGFEGTKVKVEKTHVVTNQWAQLTSRMFMRLVI